MALFLWCRIMCIVWVLVFLQRHKSHSLRLFYSKSTALCRSAWGPGRLLLGNQKPCLEFCQGIHCVLETAPINWGQLAMNLAINYESYLAQVKFCGNCINDSKMGERAKTEEITVLQIAGFHGTLKALLILQL